MTAPPDRRSAHALAGACVGLVAAAALLWGAGIVVWYRGVAGRVSASVDGATVHPALPGLALLALAGVAALVATSGLVRRGLAAGLGAVGVAVAVVAGFDQLAAPPPGTVATPAPLLAVAGGISLVAVAAFVVVREPRLARMGARYAAPGTRRAGRDPDRLAWTALDAGRDPTVDPAPGAGDPGDGGRGGPV